MGVAGIFLGLLEDAPRHGYELKHVYDELFAREHPINFGQVYTTLRRLERDGLVMVASVESGPGPQRKLYAITDEGATDLDRWLRTPEPPAPQLHSVLFAKVLIALSSGRHADELLERQRAAHLDRMRQLTATRRSASQVDALLADLALFHLEADLRWIDVTAGRLDKLREAVT